MVYWTEEEDELLKELWPSINLSKEQLLNIFESRTYGALSARAQIFGISRPVSIRKTGKINYDYLKKIGIENTPQVEDSPELIKPKIWSKKEVQTLKELYPREDITIHDLKKVFIDRTVLAIRNRANLLGLKRPDTNSGKIDYEYLKKLTEVVDG